MEEQLRANFQAVFDACASRLLPLSSRLATALLHAAPWPVGLAAVAASTARRSPQGGEAMTS